MSMLCSRLTGSAVRQLPLGSSSAALRCVPLLRLRPPVAAAAARWYSRERDLGEFQPELMLPTQRSTPPNFGVVIVPQQEAWVVERFGQFRTTLSPGLHFLLPLVDRIAYVHSLKEEAHRVAHQTAITKDNVIINIDGILYVKVVDPMKASYGVEDPIYAVMQLAQTTMRSELGKITLDKTFEEREALNLNIVEAINVASRPWGIEAMRYEIRDITPPPSVKKAMDMQAEAERKKRAMILDSEGLRQAAINEANGVKEATVLRAEGEAEALKAKAAATAVGLELVSQAINMKGGADAVTMRVAEQYVTAFGNLAKESTTMLLPGNAADAGSMVAQALAVFNRLPTQSVVNATSTRISATSKPSDSINANSSAANQEQFVPSELP